jgi:CMP-N-acetylneuraminic acid synthetase
MRLVNKRPLIDFTIEFALNVFSADHIFFTSDDLSALEWAASKGIKTIVRPSVLALDETPMLEVLKHALSVIGDSYKRLVLLQPTSPLRQVTEIIDGMALFDRTAADVVCSVSPIPVEQSPYLAMKEVDGCLAPVLTEGIPTRRQDCPTTYIRNGQFYIFGTEHVLNTKEIFRGKSVAFHTVAAGINIDSEADWEEFCNHVELKLASL